MEVSVKRTDLLSALAVVISAIDTENILDNLSKIMINAYDSNVIRIRGTDLINSVISTVPCQTKLSGSVVLEASQLATCLKTMGDSEVLLSTKANEQMLVKSGKTKFVLKTNARNAFNKIPVPESPVWTTVPGEQLLDMVSKTSEFAHADNTRYELNGICLKPSNSGTMFMSANGFVLSFASIPKIKLTNKSVIVPLKGCLVLKKLLKSSEAAQVFISDEHFFVKYRDFELSVKLTNSNFPDLSPVMSMPISTVLMVERTAIMDIVKRALVLKKDTLDITLQIREANLGFRVVSEALGSLDDELPAQTIGSELDVILNVDFLLKVVRSLESPVLIFGFHGPLNTVFAKPFAQDTYDHLIAMMPRLPS